MSRTKSEFGIDSIGKIQGPYVPLIVPVSFVISCSIGQRQLAFLGQYHVALNVDV